MMVLLCNNLNIHFGNQFSSRKRWVPISRHSFQVRCPSLGRRCTMIILNNSHNIHLGSQFSSRKRWIPIVPGLITWSDIDFLKKVNKTLIIVLLGGIDFMSLFQTWQDFSSSKDHTCHGSYLGGSTAFRLNLFSHCG